MAEPRRTGGVCRFWTLHRRLRWRMQGAPIAPATTGVSRAVNGMAVHKPFVRFARLYSSAASERRGMAQHDDTATRHGAMMSVVEFLACSPRHRCRRTRR